MGVRQSPAIARTIGQRGLSGGAVRLLMAMNRHRLKLGGTLAALAALAIAASQPEPVADPPQNFQTVPDRDFAELPLERVDMLYARLLQSLVPSEGETIYQAYQTGQPIVRYVFARGSSRAQLAILEQTASFLAGLPRYADLPGRSLLDPLARGLEGQGGRAAKIGEAIAQRGASFDGLPLPTRAELDDYRTFPMRQGERLAITSGNAQQFGYLLAEITRLAADKTPPPGGERAWRSALRRIHDFAAHDTLRFYWLEMPGWHWAGAYPNVRARTLAKLAGEPKLTPRRFFRAFIDYDLHLFAIAADLVAAERAAPWLIDDPADRAAVIDAHAIGLRVLKERIDRGPGGQGFGFDRGYWRDNPVAAYASCTDPRPPAAECRWAEYVSDISHAQRWPSWLESFAAADDGKDAALIAHWQAGLARSLAEKVLSKDAAGRPLMRNFMDGHDGWYLFTGTQPGGSGSRPSSLTGWAMRYGAWAQLAPLDGRIAEAHRRFCAVIASRDAADIAFRTRNYGAPGADPANGFMSTKDEYGPDSYYVLPCRIGAAMKLY